MSMESVISEHLDEGDVVRLLDDEATAAELGLWTAHLQSCERCRRLREDIGETSGWFRSTVSILDRDAKPDDVTRARALGALRARLDSQAAAAPQSAGVPAPLKGNGRGSSGPPVLRRPSYSLAAAGIGIILFAGLGVEPVRAWIRENILSIQPQAEAPAVEGVSAPAPMAAPVVSASFETRGPVFSIELSQRQQEGTLTIRLTSDDQASAQIVGSVAETLVVLPSGLSVGNNAGSKASYIVELPANEIREIVVRAGGQLIGSRTVSSAGEEVELDLATGAAAP